MTEIEWTWDGEGIVGNRWSRTDFVRDPLVIQYLTEPTLNGFLKGQRSDQSLYSDPKNHSNV